MNEGISVKKLSKCFRTISALSDVSFNVSKGQLFGVLGPDGSGKTTLCRILAGILTPDEGEIKIKALDIVKDCEKLKLITGYVPRDYGLYGDLSVGENIDFYADIFMVPSEDREKRKKQILDITNLTKFTKRLSAKLSGGMKQKLQLACALIHTPEFLILDEPTYGVDPISRKEFWGLLNELLAQGITIVLSTSYMDEAERCSEIALLHKGKILKLDKTENIIASIKGSMFELICKTPLETAKTLKTLKGVMKVNVYGDTIHVLTENDEKIITDTLNKDSLISLTKINPSIEDCFIYFTENAQ